MQIITAMAACPIPPEKALDPLPVCPHRPRFVFGHDIGETLCMRI